MAFLRAARCKISGISAPRACPAVTWSEITEKAGQQFDGMMRRQAHRCFLRGGALPCSHGGRILAMIFISPPQHGHSCPCLSSEVGRGGPPRRLERWAEEFPCGNAAW